MAARPVSDLGRLDARAGAMTQVAVAPCSPFSVSRDLMKTSAELARALGVRLHTYLAENDHAIAYSLKKSTVRQAMLLARLRKSMKAPFGCDNAPLERHNAFSKALSNATC